jgi:hypothetical protein
MSKRQVAILILLTGYYHYLYYKNRFWSSTWMFMFNYQWVAGQLAKRKIRKNADLTLKQAFDMFALDAHRR